MERAGHPAAGVAGAAIGGREQAAQGLVDYLRQKRPELRQEWASRITDAQLLRVMRADEIFTEVTAVYDNYVNALETGSVEALRAYARDMSERIVRRGVETDEVLGTVLLLRDVLARALFLRHQGDPELLGRVLDVYEPAANRIAVTVGVSFVEERERVIREQQAAIRERAAMLHRLSTFLADAPHSRSTTPVRSRRSFSSSPSTPASLSQPSAAARRSGSMTAPRSTLTLRPSQAPNRSLCAARGRRGALRRRCARPPVAADELGRARRRAGAPHARGNGRPGTVDAQLARGVALRFPTARRSG